MTGRELIVYIMENHLEDEEVFKDGRLLGFMNTIESAIKFDVGYATINAWINTGMLPGACHISGTYIPANLVNPKDTVTNSSNK